MDDEFSCRSPKPFDPLHFCGSERPETIQRQSRSALPQLTDSVARTSLKLTGVGEKHIFISDFRLLDKGTQNRPHGCEEAHTPDSNAALEMPTACISGQDLVKFLAVGRAANFLHERFDGVPLALWSKIGDANHVAARTEAAALAITIYSYHNALKNKAILKNSLKATEKLKASNQLIDSTPSNLPSFKNSAPVPEIAIFSPNMQPVATERSQNGSNSDKRAQIRPLIETGGSSLSASECAVIGTVSAGAICFAGAVILETIRSTEQNDEMMLGEVQHLREKKLLHTMNTELIYGNDNGGKLIPESP